MNDIGLTKKKTPMPTSKSVAEEKPVIKSSSLLLASASTNKAPLINGIADKMQKSNANNFKNHMLVFIDFVFFDNFSLTLFERLQSSYS